MKLPERLKDSLTTLLVGGISGIFLFFATKIYHDISAPFLAYVLPAFSNKTLLAICSILLLTVTLLVGYVIYLQRSHREPSQAEIAKQFHARFEGAVDPGTGLWKHRTKSGYFCPNCKAWLRESQMVTAEKAKEWFCPVLDCTFVILNPGMFGPGVRPVKLGPGELG